MEHLVKEFLPAHPVGKAAVAIGGLLVGGWLLSFPYNFISWQRTDRYRLSVCWDHYSNLDISFRNYSKFSNAQRMQSVREYSLCLKAARKGSQINPPSTKLEL